jgi:hypothetical protein
MKKQKYQWSGMGRAPHLANNKDSVGLQNKKEHAKKKKIAEGKEVGSAFHP